MTDNIEILKVAAQAHVASVNAFVITQTTAMDAFLTALKAVGNITPPQYYPNDAPFPPTAADDWQKEFDAVEPVMPEHFTPAQHEFETSVDANLSEADDERPDVGQNSGEIEDALTDANARAAEADGLIPAGDIDQKVDGALVNLPDNIAAEIDLNIAVPSKDDYAIDVEDPNYKSNITDAVRGKILSDLSSASGVAPHVEDAAWKRDELQRDYAFQLAADQIADEWSLRGFSRPNGMLYEPFDALVEKERQDKVDRERTIAKSQEDMAQANTHQALNLGVSFEGMMIAHYDAVKDRALNAARSVIDVGIAIMDGQLRRLAILTQAGKTIVNSTISVEQFKLGRIAAALDAFVKKLDAALAKIKGYTAMYGIDTDIYKTAVSKADMVARLQLAVDNARTTRNEFDVSMNLQSHDVNSRNSLAVSRLNASVVETLAIIKSSANRQGIQNDDANREIALKAAAIALRAFLNVAKLKVGASKSGAAIHAKAIASVQNALNTVVQIGAEATDTYSQE